MSRQTNYQTVQTDGAPQSVLTISDLAAFRCHKFCYIIKRLVGGKVVKADKFLEGDADQLNKDHDAIYCLVVLMQEMIPQP